MPKLQKHSAWKRKGKEYSKWVITLPGREVEKAGFKEGEELGAMATHHHIIMIYSKDAEKLLLSQPKKKLSKTEKAYREAFEAYTREKINEAFDK